MNKIMKNKLEIQTNLIIQNENTYLLMAWEIFKKTPNSLSIFGMYDKHEFFKIIDSIKESQTVTQEIIKVEELDIINVSYFIKINDGVYLSYNIQDSKNDYTTINEIEFYYKDDSDYDKVQEIIDLINVCTLTFEQNDSINKLNTLVITAEGLDVEPIPIEINENLELFYTNETYKSINKLIKSIKKNNKGLSVFYGDRGTGKTSIIPYIANNLDRIVIYIPNNLLDTVLNSNDFKTFLKSHAKPIIIIDDCENIFNEMYNKSNSYTNNILQLVDGILSDVIELNIILISNSEIDEIDSNLLDANSFIDSIEFKYLSTKESNILSKHLNLDKKHKNKTRLIDVIKNKTQTDDKKIGLK